ncbi:MAG TPA: pyrimidine/purine nucleoside phosphorylase [Noviherbaspirillum sp.]|nr:pyrimidine/purine nucleoside phosphorylase [Noviherbaspirillum sp.]
MSTQFEHVSIPKKANIYFGGKCISHNLYFPGGSRKTIGVLLPATVTFTTDGPEIMEIVSGHCRARIGDDGEWKEYHAGQRFRVPGQTRFDMEADEPVEYICHFTHD